MTVRGPFPFDTHEFSIKNNVSVYRVFTFNNGSQITSYGGVHKGIKKISVPERQRVRSHTSTK